MTRGRLKPYKKGQSGNPGGRPKNPPYFRKRLKEMLPDVLEMLARDVKSKDVLARSKARDTVLGYLKGKPAQAVLLGNHKGKPFEASATAKVGVEVEVSRIGATLDVLAKAGAIPSPGNAETAAAPADAPADAVHPPPADASSGGVSSPSTP